MSPILDSNAPRARDERALAETYSFSQPLIYRRLSNIPLFPCAEPCPRPSLPSPFLRPPFPSFLHGLLSCDSLGRTTPETTTTAPFMLATAARSLTMNRPNRQDNYPSQASTRAPSPKSAGPRMLKSKLRRPVLHVEPTGSARGPKSAPPSSFVPFHSEPESAPYSQTSTFRYVSPCHPKKRTGAEYRTDVHTWSFGYGVYPAPILPAVAHSAPSSPSSKTVRQPGQVAATRSIPIFGDHDHIAGTVDLDPTLCGPSGQVTLTVCLGESMAPSLIAERSP